MDQTSLSIDELRTQTRMSAARRLGELARVRVLTPFAFESTQEYVEQAARAEVRLAQALSNIERSRDLGRAIAHIAFIDETFVRAPEEVDLCDPCSGWIPSIDHLVAPLQLLCDSVYDAFSGELALEVRPSSDPRHRWELVARWD